MTWVGFVLIGLSLSLVGLCFLGVELLRRWVGVTRIR